MSKFVAIVNYGVGNLTSVSNALHLLGITHEITDKPENLEAASHIILPGVGSFKAGMEGLERGGWIHPFKKAALLDKKPILGICLGMQLFASEGMENGRHLGLDIVPGIVEKIPVTEVPLPHIGWNDVTIKTSRIMRGLDDGSHFYFVHSYRLVPHDETIIVGVAQYDVPITATIESGNIFGTQFHPEKSQENGMQILRNFASL